ncbi:MAG: homocysteine S-methyltransferase, partial [Rhodobacterales bacterium]|nr:homocysteine S-methyltransferase [Rhodobacterales bacterium]
KHAMGWIAQGATLVGGCCETGPAHIAALAHAIRAAGHTIV